jgi:hypothetical protein
MCTIVSEPDCSRSNFMDNSKAKRVLGFAPKYNNVAECVCLSGAVRHVFACNYVWQVRSNIDGKRLPYGGCRVPLRECAAHGAINFVLDS